jgi:hypothetical protein
MGVDMGVGLDMGLGLGLGLGLAQDGCETRESEVVQ